MTRTRIFVILFFGFSLTLACHAQPQAFGFLDPQGQSAESSSSHEDELYNSATNNLNSGNYDQAINGYDQVVRMRGRRADAALYWKAYALAKAARKQEALTSIDELERAHPRSRWDREARILERELRGLSGPDTDPNTEADEEIKILALNSLMHADPERATAAAANLMQGNSSLKVKERVLFILAQSKSEKAQEILVSAAKGAAYPELQARAIKWLAIAGGTRNSQTLQEIYASSSSDEVKREVLRSFIINHDKDAVFKIAQQEKTPELKQDAIRQLGVMGARDELRQLYKTAGDPESKESVLRGLSILGDQESLIEIAKTETDNSVRAHAIRGLGITEGPAAVEALVAIYNSNSDIDTKRQAIRSLFIHRDAKDMVALARKETNPELKKELVRSLSNMHSPEATEYMLELLNKQ